jgi:hypothetical protein
VILRDDDLFILISTETIKNCKTEMDSVEKGAGRERIFQIDLDGFGHGPE